MRDKGFGVLKMSFGPVTSSSFLGFLSRFFVKDMHFPIVCKILFMEMYQKSHPTIIVIVMLL